VLDCSRGPWNRPRRSSQNRFFLLADEFRSPTPFPSGPHHTDPERYAARIAPLLVSPDLEGHSGALFNQKGFAIVPLQKLANGAHVAKFLAESEALVARAIGKITHTR
jgi:hypothetical protein